MTSKAAFALLICLLVSPMASAAPEAETSLGELKMQKRFGVGLSAGGPLSVLGTEVDFNISEVLSIGGGIGTGLDYSTAMVKARFFLPGRWVSPYIGGGFAHWWTDGTKQSKISPSVLTSKFLDPGYNYNNGFSVFIFYPAVGVQFMNPLGIAISAEVEYLFKLFSLANGTYAGLGIHWYF